MISAEFCRELQGLINRHSIENVADMPDYLLAEMVCGFIDSIGPCIKRTLDWHGCDSVCHPKRQAEDPPSGSSEPAVIFMRDPFNPFKLASDGEV